MGFKESIDRLRTKTAVTTGQAVTLTIGGVAGYKAMLVGSLEGMEFGEYDRATPRVSFMVPWGSSAALPQEGGPVVVTAGQYAGETFVLAGVTNDARVSAGHIVIECGGQSE